MTSAGKTGSCFPDEKERRAAFLLQCVFRIPLPHKGAESFFLLCAALRKRTAETQKEDFLCIHIPFPPTTGALLPGN